MFLGRLVPMEGDVTDVVHLFGLTVLELERLVSEGHLARGMESDDGVSMRVVVLVAEDDDALMGRVGLWLENQRIV